MDPQVQASFIPKKPLDTGANRMSSAGVGLAFIVALFLFIASIAAAGSAFVYKKHLEQSVIDKSKALETAQSAYKAVVIEDLLRLDVRMNQAQTLLSKHVAASAIFSFLSSQTLEKVSFSSFSYTLGADGSAEVSLAGSGDSFSTVALQSDQFGANKALKNVVFSSISVGEKGVSFSVHATVNASLVLYSKALEGTSNDVSTTTSQI